MSDSWPARLISALLYIGLIGISFLIAALGGWSSAGDRAGLAVGGLVLGFVLTGVSAVVVARRVDVRTVVRAYWGHVDS